MAFENVFGNVDFGAPQRQENLEQQRFAQMLGMGLQAAQASEDRKLQERQMELDAQAKANEFDMKGETDNAMLKAALGMSLEPKEQALIDVYQAKQRPIYDPVTGSTLAAPNFMGSLRGGQPRPQQAVNPSVGGEQLAIRNNNPLNMRPVGASEGFQKFNDPQEGLERTKKDLFIKISGKSNAMKAKHGENYVPSLENLISTWAPSSENDTQNYIDNVSKWSGIDPKRPLKPNDIDSLIPAMARMEGGQENVDALGAMSVPYQQPQDVVSDEPYQASGRFKGTPVGDKMEEESRQKIQDTFVAEKMKRNLKGAERFADAQLTAANFGNRMIESNKILSELTNEDKSAQEGMTGKAGITKRVLDILPLGEFGSQLGDAAVHLNATESQQKYMNAAENWITANLRKESGAVIGADEMVKEYKKYFPMVGDSGALIEQKEKLRGQAEKGMIGQSAGAYQEVFGRKGQALRSSPNTQSKPTRDDIMRELERRK